MVKLLRDCTSSARSVHISAQAEAVIGNQTDTGSRSQMRRFPSGGKDICVFKRIREVPCGRDLFTNGIMGD